MLVEVMERRYALLLLASLCAAAPRKGKPKGKGAEVSVLQIVCRRAGGDVSVDGRLKAGEKSIKKLSLFVDFLGTDKQLLQTKRGEVDEEMLQPGDEAEFHMRVVDPVRAVLYSIRAEDGDGRDLRLDKAGPFPIE